MVDTGADVSVLPPNIHDRKQTCKRILYAANGTPIKTYGERLTQLNLNLRRSFCWPFIIADVQHAIIGADFLNNYGLLIDVKHKRLIDSTTHMSTLAMPVKRPVTESIYLIDPQNKYPGLLKKYPNIFRDNPKYCTTGIAFSHTISTIGPPVSAKARRLPPDKLAQAKLEFQKMINLGICRPSKSPWSSPLHLVLKGDGSWRP